MSHQLKPPSTFFSWREIDNCPFSCSKSLAWSHFHPKKILPVPKARINSQFLPRAPYKLQAESSINVDLLRLLDNNNIYLIVRRASLKRKFFLWSPHPFNIQLMMFTKSAYPQLAFSTICFHITFKFLYFSHMPTSLFGWAILYFLWFWHPFF